MAIVYTAVGIDQIWTHQGQAVLPVSDEEGDAIARVAAVHGIELVRIDPASCRTDPVVTETSASVIALGADAMPAVRLYAHLAACTAVLCQTVDEIPVGPTPRIIVTTYAHWTDELAERCAVHEAAASAAPGLILAPDEQSLVAAVKKHAITLRRACSGPPRFTIISDEFSMDDAESGEAHSGLTGIGRGADIERVKAAISGPTDLLAVFTHSDGFDSPLPGGAVVCPYVVEPLHQIRAAGSACLETSTCHRTQETDR